MRPYHKDILNKHAHAILSALRLSVLQKIIGVESAHEVVSALKQISEEMELNKQPNKELNQ